MHAELAAALAAGDTDALRLAFRDQMSAPAGNSSDHNTEDLPGDSPASNALIAQAGAVADNLLKQALPHLEREARVASTDTDHDAATMLPMPELGLTLGTTPVMGQIVWPAALALSRWLLARRGLCNGARCLELGAGAGAPGLIARSAGATQLLLTEGDDSLLPVLRANCEANPGPGAWAAATLDWRDFEAVGRTHSGDGRGFDLILAADVLYTAGDIAPLVRAAARLLRPGATSRFVLARSSWFEDLTPTLVACAEEAGFILQSSERMEGSRATTKEADPAARGAELCYAEDVRDADQAVVLEFAMRDCNQ